jgi:hypothetical protein
MTPIHPAPASRKVPARGFTIRRLQASQFETPVAVWRHHDRLSGRLSCWQISHSEADCQGQEGGILLARSGCPVSASRDSSQVDCSREAVAGDQGCRRVLTGLKPDLQATLRAESDDGCSTDGYAYWSWRHGLPESRSPWGIMPSLQRPNAQRYHPLNYAILSA